MWIHKISYRVNDAMTNFDVYDESAIDWFRAEGAKVEVLREWWANPETSQAVDADEFFSFDGEPEFDKPPYWVARLGNVVTEQVDVRDVRTITYPDVATARAHFADQTCDPVVGAPRVGDTIRITWGLCKRSTFHVDAVEPISSGWRVVSAGFEQDLAFGQYVIVSRPAEHGDYRCQWEMPDDEEPDRERCPEQVVDGGLLCQAHQDLHDDLTDQMREQDGAYQC